MCDVYTMEYYLALKMKEILVHATTQMNFEDTMLSEVSLKRTSTVRFHLYEVLEQLNNGFRLEDGDCQGPEGKRNGELLFHETVSVLRDVLEMDDGCPELYP